MMMDTVDLLEEIGKNAKIKDASNGELQVTLDCLHVDPEISTAVLSRDSLQLEQMLGVKTNICCIQWPSEDEEGEEEPDDAPADDEDDLSRAVNL